MNAFGKQGLLRSNIGNWRDYLRADFRPRQPDSDLSARWLAGRRELLAPVGEAAT